MRWWALVILALSLAGARPASATVVLSVVCHTESDLARYLPERTPEALKPFAVIDVCTYGDGHRDGRLSAPAHHGDGVCSILYEYVYLAPDAKGEDVESDPPKDSVQAHRPDWGKPKVEMMLTGDASCPQADDAGYLTTSGVPEGVFSGLVRIWGSIQARPEALDGYLAGSLPPGAVAELRDALAARAPALSLADVSFDPGTQWPSAPGGIGRYVLTIRAAPEGGKWYALAFDWMPAGFRIVGLDIIVS